MSMTRRALLRASGGAGSAWLAGAEKPLPNILWITLEDTSADLGCYGTAYATTPRMDRLASEGIRYTRVWSNAGMCSPARATLITGMYANATGAQHQRSLVSLPEYIRAFPEFLRRAGYYTSNHVKTDYNWQAPKETWDAQDPDWMAHGWRRRAPGQPFFTVINLTATHSSQLYWRGDAAYRKRAAELGPALLHPPEKAPVPPYYPDTAAFRQEVARYHDNLTYVDRQVGEILDRLQADGLAEETVIFLFGDNGRGFPRGKSWCFQDSLHVPLIVRVPKRFAHLAPGRPGSTSDRLTAFVDFAPTVLNLAGLAAPEYMHGRAFLGPGTGPPPAYLFSFRDRMDERYDLTRAVWDGRYKYIRNYLPHLPWFHEQTQEYMHSQESLADWHRLAAQGKLTRQAAVYMARERPSEMLFDLSQDPHELDNLAGSSPHSATLERLRSALHAWQEEIMDLGFMPESEWYVQFESNGDRTPRRTLARERPRLYPLKELRSMAELLSEGSSAVAKQLAGLESANAAIRYWAALGLLASKSDSEAIRLALRGRLDDASPAVRATVAQALVALGEANPAMQRLTDLLKHPEPFVILCAATALDHLGEKARPALPQIRQYLKDHKAQDSEQASGKVYPEWVFRHTLRALALEP